MTRDLDSNRSHVDSWPQIFLQDGVEELDFDGWDFASTDEGDDWPPASDAAGSS